MKHEWKKKEKDIYMPPKKPVVVDIKAFNYFTIDGAGNPNSPIFAECIEALYGVSYSIRMSYKKNREPSGFYEYTVYPLEGLWDITEEAKKTYNGDLNKDDLVFTLMIRQPDFVTAEYAQSAIAWTKEKKNNPLLDKLTFIQKAEGRCVQMMHLGSYDNEPATFAIMEEFCTVNALRRKSKKHKEIYISDPRKVAPEKLKTVLRFQVTH